MPRIAPLIVAATSLSRNVGTPTAAAAVSSSRIAARPAPTDERSIAAEATAAAAEIANIVKQRYSVKVVNGAKTFGRTR